MNKAKGIIRKLNPGTPASASQFQMTIYIFQQQEILLNSMEKAGKKPQGGETYIDISVIVM